MAAWQISRLSFRYFPNSMYLHCEFSVYIFLAIVLMRYHLCYIDFRTLIRVLDWQFGLIFLLSKFLRISLGSKLKCILNRHILSL